MDGMSTEGKAYRVFKMLNTALMILFTLNTVFLPVDNFELKILSLLALLVVNANVILLPKTQDERIVFVFGFLLTTMNILFSVLWTKELVSNIRIGYCGYILLLYSIIKKYKIDFARIITVVLFLLADFMLLMAFLDLSGILAFENNPILMWLYQTGNAMVGKGAHLPIYYAIFMKTSPMLLLVIPYCIKSKKWIHTVICTAALVISGTRANIFMAMLVLLLCILLCLRGRLFRNIRNRFRCDTKIPLRYILCAWVGGTVVIWILTQTNLVNFAVDMFVRKAGSDAIRNGHMQSLLAYWSENPLHFLRGDGFSSSFYSSGIGDYTSNIELSYWNLLRQVGVFPFLATIIMLVYPLWPIIRKKENVMMLIGYVAYLIVAYTNPLLYSSTGLTVILFIYVLCGKEAPPSPGKRLSYMID